MHLTEEHRSFHHRAKNSKMPMQMFFIRKSCYIFYFTGNESDATIGKTLHFTKTKKFLNFIFWWFAPTFEEKKLYFCSIAHPRSKKGNKTTKNVSYYKPHYYDLSKPLLQLKLPERHGILSKKKGSEISSVILQNALRRSGGCA